MRRLCLIFALSLPLPAFAVDEARLDTLFEALAVADEDSYEAIADDIREELSESGSPSMDLLLHRGRVALMRGNLAEAIEHFTVLVENAPDFAEGWNSRATAYYQEGLIGPAIEDIARVLTLEPRHFGALSGLALILEQTGDLQNALEVYERVHEINPMEPNVTFAIGELERQLGINEL